jgi:signal transduction histidine kinase
MAKTDKDEQIRVLLVEDDADSGEALKAMLKKRDTVVTLVPDAEQALRLFKPDAFDILVVDIRLQGMSGVDLLGHIRQIDGDFPVILLTGFDSLESAIQAVRLGAQDYILKPLDRIDDLLLPIKKAVNTHRLLLLNRKLEEERRVAHEELERSREELRALSARLAETEETERRRLGRDLHDQAGQMLTALGISLAIARNQLPRDCEAEAVHRLDDAMRQLETMAEQIRHVMSELRPPMLDDYGLSAALQWYGEQFSRRTRLPVEVQAVELAHRSPANVEAALFRITQEALSNVAKHAQARKVVVTLEEKNPGVRLTIADDGVGFDPRTVREKQARSGWGVLLMRERAMAVGGRMSMYSAPGKGVRVVVETER